MCIAEEDLPITSNGRGDIVQKTITLGYHFPTRIKEK
jgi:hypothetical protein